MSVQQPPVVVGVDESAGADQAVAWAAEEARSRGVGLRLVCGYGSALTYGGLAMYGSMPPADPTLARKVTSDLLATAAARVRELAPELDVTTHVVDDEAARALIDESAGASLIVLGSRHLHSVGSVLLGSVSAAVSAQAACPVVVLRGPAGLAAEHAAVVVGVDGHPSSEAVIEFAFDYAGRRSVPLRAVLCWHPDRLAEMMWRAEPPRTGAGAGVVGRGAGRLAGQVPRRRGAQRCRPRPSRRGSGCRVERAGSAGRRQSWPACVGRNAARLGQPRRAAPCNVSRRPRAVDDARLGLSMKAYDVFSRAGQTGALKVVLSREG